MSWREEALEPVSAEKTFDQLTINQLKPLVLLLTDEVPTRKAELVGVLVRHMTNPAEVRSLYHQLAPLARQAVEEATHEPRGFLHRDKFIARYGDLPDFHEPAPERERSSYSADRTRPTLLRLFFPRFDWMPTDVRQLLLSFVPAPPAFKLPTVSSLPETVTQTWKAWKDNRPVEESEEVPLRVRETARDAEQDLRTVLRLIEAGRFRVSDKKQQPTVSSRQALAPLLSGGDFYPAEDEEDSKGDPASDLGLKTFAWPMIVQAGGLAQKSGEVLTLTPAGRKALSGPGAEAIRTAFRKWRSSSLLDEFSRVEAIKGQGKGSLSALAARRKAVLDGLAACPPGEWFAVDDFFRFLRATDRDFVVAHHAWQLYVAELRYGNLSYGGGSEWEMLQGRYILAVLFEYVATLGLIDVAYLVPQGARDDYQDHWGTDDLSCLSRYDGLLYVRINSLGAWCLDLTEAFEALPVTVVDVIRVLPNLDVVVTKPPLPAADRLLLDRFAESQSEGVWKLTPAKALSILEEGVSLDALEEFLKTHTSEALPHTVEVFFQDQRNRAGRLRDLGMTRLIECADATLAQMLASDPLLRGKCHLAGERWLIFQAEDETVIRRALKRLGHILPPQKP